MVILPLPNILATATIPLVAPLSLRGMALFRGCILIGTLGVAVLAFEHVA